MYMDVNEPTSHSRGNGEDVIEGKATQTQSIKTSKLSEPKTGKLKVQLSLCLTKQHDMKTYWRSGGIAPRILDLVTGRR
jgi:hypothetical protein